jgi:hypothetical protein
MIKRRSILAGGCLVLTFGSLTKAAFGALPPTAYMRWQQEAPEALLIRVLDVQSQTEEVDNQTSRTHFKVTAVVLAIARTASQLKDGDQIIIEYTQTNHKRPMPGPEGMPTLIKQSIIPAFLGYIETKKTYYPKAHAYSFRFVN